MQKQEPSEGERYMGSGVGGAGMLRGPKEEACHP